MSEELNQKKEALRLLWSFNQYFTSANGVDVPDRISVKRDEWRLLCEALCAALSQPTQPAQPDTQWQETTAALNHYAHKGEWPTQPASHVPEANCGNSAWFALVMGAAASIEDAQACLRDVDAKRAAAGAAKHYRDAANTLWASQKQPTQPAQVGWQPISTAPKDGQKALVYRPLAAKSNDPEITIKRLIGGKQFCWPSTVPDGQAGFNPTDGLCHVTHWMPIPPAPTALNGGKA